MALKVIDTARLDAIADAINAKTGKTEKLTLDEMVTEIENISGGGGEQPEIFAPVVVEMFNQVQWKNNEKNGNFAVTITATVNGEEVASPLMITEEMNGKNLIIRAECENFKGTKQIIPLAYRALDMSDATHSVFFTSGAPNPPDNSKPYKPVIDISNADKLAGVNCIAVADTFTDQRGSNDRNFWNEIEFNTLYREQFYIEVTEALTGAYCYINLKYVNTYTNGFYSGSGTSSSVSWTSGTINIKVYVNGELRKEDTQLGKYLNIGEVAVGDKITFFIEAHVAS